MMGRKKELEQIEDIYSKNGFGFIAMYGRRRVGKMPFLIYQKNYRKKSVF